MKRIFIAFSMIIGSISVHAQLIDVFQVHVGIAKFPVSELLNKESLRVEDMWGAFSPGPVVGVGVSKFITDKIQLGASVEQMINSSKPYFNMSYTKTSLSLKYNFIAPDIYTFSPYIVGQGDFLFLLLSQSAPFSEGSPANEDKKFPEINIDKLQYSDNSYNYQVPIIGGGAGIGLDINIFSRYSIFAEATYHYNMTKNTVLNNPENPYVSGNKSDLTYFNLLAGLRIYLY